MMFASPEKPDPEGMSICYYLHSLHDVLVLVVLENCDREMRHTARSG